MTIEQLQKAHESGATIEIRYEECGDNDKPWRWREEPNPDWSLDADYYRLAKPNASNQTPPLRSRDGLFSAERQYPSTAMSATDSATKPTPPLMRLDAMPCCLSSFLDRVIHGDNCETLAAMSAESVDLVVTSPPYDDLRTYGGHSWDFERLASELTRVLKPGGVIVWVVADKTEDGSETGTSMGQALHFRSIGLRLHDTMIWKRLSLPLNHNRYEQEFEFMFVMSKGKPRIFNGERERCVSYGRAYPGGSTRQGGDDSREHNKKRDIKEDRLRGNVWEIETGYMKATKDVQAYDHPAIFPEELAKLHIRSWSNPGDVVLDPFAGSGTTLKAAKELNRRFVGIEINPDYCTICEARLAQDVLLLETSDSRPNKALSESPENEPQR